MKSKEDIRNFRNKLAGKYKVQPSAIFPDQSIDMLFSLQPTSLLELAGKPQFPANGVRVKIYGREIVDFFKDSKSESVVEDMVSKSFV